jgi:uncharacterized protein
VPFWSSVLTIVAAIAIGFAVSVIAMIAIYAGVILTSGITPSTKSGHPLESLAELFFYGAAGAFLWFRLRPIRRGLLRKLSGGDLRAIAIGIGVLFLLRIGTAVQLAATHQTKHVQSGFEHFDVVTKLPIITTLGIALTVAAMVIAGPVVEEIAFRGLLFGALAQRLGVLAAALVSAVIFGAVHGDLVLFPTLAGLGFVGALAYAATRNLMVPIALHMLNNAVGAAFLVTASLRHSH